VNEPIEKQKVEETLLPFWPFGVDQTLVVEAREEQSNKADRNDLECMVQCGVERRRGSDCRRGLHANRKRFEFECGVIEATRSLDLDCSVVQTLMFVCTHVRPLDTKMTDCKETSAG